MKEGLSKLSFCWVLCLAMLGSSKIWAAQTVSSVKVRGNQRVESSAVVSIITSKKGEPIDRETVKNDILALYELGYFSDIRVYQNETAEGLELIYELKEKPAIIDIKFSGASEISEDDLRSKIEVKQFTIVNEGVINNDIRLIEKQYLEKGFYLAKASYRLIPEGDKGHEVTLEYTIDEAGKVLIGDVAILGNRYFSDTDLIATMLSKPFSRNSFMSAPGSVYNEEFVKRDAEMVSYLYKDQGFAEVKVASPIQQMDADRRFVRLTFELEEGTQYSVGGIKLSGDILYPEGELEELMLLKKDELFRFSQFRKDVEMLIDKYGDKGYAFVDVNPKTRFDKEKALVYLNYEITKGEKVYFGDFIFSGNTKTRDNVIRRELEVAEGELYSGTQLSQSKRNVERLGYFEQVQTVRSRDLDRPDLLHYRFQVKEKPTGQLQAALGYSPNTQGGESGVFGQGRYSEENQSGRGWRTSLTGRWNGENNYSLEVGFTNPRVDDSDWSLGFNTFIRNDVRRLTEGVEVQEQRKGGSVTLGRRIIELVRSSITVKMLQVTQDSDVFVLERFNQDGIEKSVILALSRNATNDYLDPSEGSNIRLSQEFTGGILGGDRQYLETTLDASYYYPIDFSDTYRTYFHMKGRFGLLWPYGDANIPLFTRYTLGGPENLRGYEYRSIGPKYTIIQAPGDQPREISGGGNKELLFQFEYFFPLIKEANIKGLFFYDMGRVYNETEQVELSGFTKDVGFGFRWITPVAPFRFEWAYPIEENGKLGDLEFIFYLGY